MNLPPLPAPDVPNTHGGPGSHSPEQMLAMQRDTARAVLEEVAKVCEKDAGEAYKRFKILGSDYFDGKCDMAHALHDAIRAMAKEIT